VAVAVLEFIVVPALLMAVVAVQVVVVLVEEPTVQETLTDKMEQVEQQTLVVEAVETKEPTHQVLAVQELCLFATQIHFQTWFQLAQVLPKKVAD
jgi:hypothetical protein